MHQNVGYSWSFLKLDFGKTIHNSVVYSFWSRGRVFSPLNSFYLVSIVIDNPEFEKYIPDIYQAELQYRTSANTSDKETSFLDLNIKVIGSVIHTSVYDKRDDFGFPIVYFPWLSGDVTRLPSYGIYISQLVRFARCTSVLDFHSKNLQITSKLLTQG